MSKQKRDLWVAIVAVLFGSTGVLAQGSSAALGELMEVQQQLLCVTVTKQVESDVKNVTAILDSVRSPSRDAAYTCRGFRNAANDVKALSKDVGIMNEECKNTEYRLDDGTRWIDVVSKHGKAHSAIIAVHAETLSKCAAAGI